MHYKHTSRLKICLSYSYNCSYLIWTKINSGKKNSTYCDTAVILTLRRSIRQPLIFFMFEWHSQAVNNRTRQCVINFVSDSACQQVIQSFRQKCFEFLNSLVHYPLSLWINKYIRSQSGQSDSQSVSYRPIHSITLSMCEWVSVWMNEWVGEWVSQSEN